jgi:hypothetical protein
VIINLALKSRQNNDNLAYSVLVERQDNKPNSASGVETTILFRTLYSKITELTSEITKLKN